MVNPLLLPELREMLEHADEPALHDFLNELHPATIAEFTEGLTEAETWALLRRAPLRLQAQVFTYFPGTKQLALVETAGTDEMAGLLAAMAPDNRVDLLKRLEPEMVEQLLPLVAKAERRDIRLLLSCPEHSAGSIMTTEYAYLPPDVTAGEAIVRLREQAPDSETIYYLYVLDADRHLLGFISLRDVILAKPQAKVGDLMRPDPIAVRVDRDQEEVAQLLAHYDFLAIPVVDEQNRLVGIVTHDDVMDVVIDEATEDAQRQGGMAPMEENYMDARFSTIWRKRSAWLSCLFVAELFTFTALAHYEDAIAAVLALSLFIPLCISTGGNSGSQAATLITRAMALRQLTPSDWWRVLRHEFAMGLALGLTLGAMGFLRAAMTPQSILGGAGRWQLAMVISQSVAAICLWGTLVGSMLPLIFHRLGFDPGYASSPFVATFVDVTGIVIYFSIAQVYLL